MIKKKEERRCEVRSGAFGGRGEIPRTHIFEADETFGRCRLMIESVVPPGASVGSHVHDKDTELYYVLEGRLTVIENGVSHILGPGDASFTGGGDSHEYRNDSDAPVRMLAIVIN